MTIMSKYEKLLGLRVKDTVFRFWDNFKKNNGDFSGMATFNNNC